MGYIVASDVVINGLSRLSLPHNIPYPSMALVLRALELRDYVERSIDEMIKVREYMIRSLMDLGLRPIPSVTNFVTFHAGSPNRANDMYDWLFNKGFVVRNLSGKVLCEDCLRVTVPPPSPLPQNSLMHWAMFFVVQISKLHGCAVSVIIILKSMVILIYPKYMRS